jgi:hypothetical protein
MKKRALIFITILPALFMTAFGQDLSFPMTWQTPVPNGYMIATLHADGTLTSCTRLGCFNCNGYGACSVCHGTGGQYWYQMGIMPCGACGGSGRCRACGGKGYSEFNASTRYGVTVVVDDNGKVYLDSSSGAGAAPDHVRRNSRHGIETIEYISTYGVDANEHVYCSKCGKTMQRHIHVIK